MQNNEHLLNLKKSLNSKLKYFTNSIENGHRNDENNPMKQYQRISLQLLDKQRDLLHKMNLHSEFDEDIIRTYLTLMDLKETSLREKVPEDARVK